MKGPGWRFGRFSVVGMTGAAIQILLQILLTKSFGLLSVAAAPVATEIALLHNFIWHERFTWNDRGAKRTGRSGRCTRSRENLRQIGGRLWRFHVGNGLISLAGNTILMYVLVGRLKAPAIPAAMGGILVCSAANFLVADRWVYAPRK